MSVRGESQSRRRRRPRGNKPWQVGAELPAPLRRMAVARFWSAPLFWPRISLAGSLIVLLLVTVWVGMESLHQKRERVRWANQRKLALKPADPLLLPHAAEAEAPRKIGTPAGGEASVKSAEPNAARTTPASRDALWNSVQAQGTIKNPALLSNPLDLAALPRIPAAAEHPVAAGSLSTSTAGPETRTSSVTGIPSDFHATQPIPPREPDRALSAPAPAPFRFRYQRLTVPPAESRTEPENAFAGFLRTFTLEESQGHLRLVAEDGSIYEGELDVEAQGLFTAWRAAAGDRPAAPPGGAPGGTGELRIAPMATLKPVGFRLDGTDHSRNQAVVIQGMLTPVVEDTGPTAKPPGDRLRARPAAAGRGPAPVIAAAPRLVRPASPPGQASAPVAFSTSLAGGPPAGMPSLGPFPILLRAKAVIGETNHVALDALPVGPP